MQKHTRFRKYPDPGGREAFRHIFYDESIHIVATKKLKQIFIYVQ